MGGMKQQEGLLCKLPTIRNVRYIRVKDGRSGRKKKDLKQREREFVS